MNFTAAIINLIDHFPWMQGAPSDGVEDQPQGYHPGTTFLDDPQRGPAAKSHLFYLENAHFCQRSAPLQIMTSQKLTSTTKCDPFYLENALNSSGDMPSLHNG
jgi:hypothetical protein